MIIVIVNIDINIDNSHTNKYEQTRGAAQEGAARPSGRVSNN